MIESVPVPRAFGEVVEPFLFRGPDKALYGCLHRPAGRADRSTAVVLCQPIGPEYIRSHRAMRQLASRLARVGRTTLRFDGYGCGDSAGDDEQGDIDQWVRDVHGAIDEVRSRVHPDELVVAGLRLGGSVAALAGSTRSDVDRMVLWDPIPLGPAYLEELRARHAKQHEMLQASTDSRPSAAAGVDTTTILGFRFGTRLVEDLNTMNLLTLDRAPAPRVLLIESPASARLEPLARHLESLSSRVEYRHVPDHEIWLAAPDTGVVPGLVLQAIVSWVARTEE